MHPLRFSARWTSVLAATVVALGLSGGGCDPPRRTASAEEPERPNFLILIADDLGPLDLGFTGSEIRTPRLDALARDGLVLTQFLVSPTCSPTRAMLLTGMDAHRVGLGTMAGEARDAQVGAPGYEGVLSTEVETLATLLGRAGYHTSIAGKWHLGREAPLRPHERGFERSFGILGGGASHFSDAASMTDPVGTVPYYLDGEPIALDEAFFSTAAYTDRLIEFVREAVEREQPFFALAAYTAPHWPLQVPDDWLDRYAGTYDDGYDALRERRFRNAAEAGLVPPGTESPLRVPFAPAWSDLSPEERAVAARKMEVYAAMVENLDHHVGRLLDELRQQGVLENTLVVFFSDNGPEGNPIDRLGDVGSWVDERFDNRLENIGRVGSYTWTGPGWAQASAAPYRLFKTFPTEGGVRTPAIVHGPVSRRGRSEAVVDVRDLAPTLLDYAGAPVPAAMTGRSMQSFLDGAAEMVRGDDEPIGYELFGRRAIRQGRWKAVWLWPPYGKGAWELFDLGADPGERHDVAAAEPERLAELLEVWEEYAERDRVVLPDADASYAIEPVTP